MMPSARPSGAAHAFHQYGQEPGERQAAPPPEPTSELRRARTAGAAQKPWSVLRRSWLLLVLADLIGLLSPAYFRGDGRLVLTGYAAMCLLLQQQTGMYRARLHLSVLTDAPTLLSRDLAAAVMVSAGIELLHLRPAVGDFSRLVVVAMAAHLLVRFLTYRWIGVARAKGRFSHPTLILGGGLVAAQIATTLQERPEYGLRPIGFLDVDPLMEPTGGGPMPHLGEFRDVRRVLAERSVQVVLVAFGNLPESAMIDVLRETDHGSREVFVVPRLYEAFGQQSSRDHIGAIPVQRIRRPARAGPSWRIKRAMDVAVSGFALLLGAPVMLAVALAVRLEGGPGVLFRQIRVGRDGKEFELLKFRSLRPANDAESATRWNVSNDSRMGTVGRFIRRTSLDELPQLLNILRGDMSLVGPRPERPHFVNRFSAEHPRYEHRHRVPCGLTGLAQVSGLRGNTSIADRARYDNYYIEHWSFWLDIKIILMTVREVVSARGG